MKHGRVNFVFTRIDPIWGLEIQNICHYMILSILLPVIWDSWFNIFVTSRDIEYLGKLIMEIFANLYGIFSCLLQGIWDIK